MAFHLSYPGYPFLLVLELVPGEYASLPEPFEAFEERYHHFRASILASLPGALL